MRAAAGVLLGVIVAAVASTSASVPLGDAQSYGVDTSGQACSEAGLQALIDAHIATAEQEGRASLATVIDLPDNARIRLCQHGVTLTKRAWLRGNGAQFRPLRDVVALTIAPSAAGTVVEQLDVQYPQDADPTWTPGQGGWRPYPHTGVGIDVRAGVTRLRDLRVWNAGTGIRLHGGGGANTSGVSVRDVWIYGCSFRGLDIRGGDSQGGVFSGVFVQACRNQANDAVGIFENSFLGNAHLGGMVEANDVGIKTDGASGGAANQSTWVGMYAENSDRVELTSNLSVIVGGALASRTVEYGARIGGSSSRLVFSGRDIYGHPVFAEMPASIRTGANAGRWDGLLRWGRLPVSNVQCSPNVSGGCLHPSDTCNAQGLCARADMPAGTNDYWVWRTTPRSDREFSWEWFAYGASASSLRAAVADVDGDGIIREGVFRVGGVGRCGYTGPICGETQGGTP